MHGGHFLTHFRDSGGVVTALLLRLYTGFGSASGFGFRDAPVLRLGRLAILLF
jgi:hypothetical protein